MSVSSYSRHLPSARVTVSLEELDQLVESLHINKRDLEARLDVMEHAAKEMAELINKWITHDPELYEKVAFYITDNGTSGIRCQLMLDNKSLFVITDR